MTSAAPSMSVVVATYDDKRWDHLERCIRSLQSQSLKPEETIVVVDHNAQLLERVVATFGDATVIANSGPRGLAGARNAGIKVSSAEVVAFIDDDACAEPDWLQQLQTCFGDPETVGVGGALLPDWDGSPPSWVPAEFFWVFGCSYTGLPLSVAPIRNPIGANMAVRASVLDQVGGFREGGDAAAPREIQARGVVRAAGNIPDDTDLAIRVNQLLPEAVWLYQPDAIVLHSVTAQRASAGYFLRRSFEEGGGKASLAHLVGSEMGLSSERSYVRKVLPKAMVREGRGVLGGDGAAALRALTIAGGVTTAALGYLSVAVPRAAMGFVNAHGGRKP